MDPMLLLIGLVFAASTALAVVYAYQRVTVPQRTIRARVTPRRVAAVVGLHAALREAPHSRVPFIDRLPLSARSRAELERELARAGVPLRVNEFLVGRIVLSVSLALALGVSVWATGLPAVMQLVAALAGVAVGWWVPGMWLARKRAERLEAIEAQLPPALTTLAKSLRIGVGLLHALGYTADETPAPLGLELAQTLRELHLGASAEDAFADFGERIGSGDVDIVVTAILTQRSVGGNLSEILTNVASTVRERARLYSEVKVLTSRQRFTGNLMAGIPILVAVAFITLNPAFGHLLIGTFAGQVALAVGVAFEVLGLVLIRKFGTIEV